MLFIWMLAWNMAVAGSPRITPYDFNAKAADEPDRKAGNAAA